MLKLHTSHFNMLMFPVHALTHMYFGGSLLQLRYWIEN